MDAPEMGFGETADDDFGRTHELIENESVSTSSDYVAYEEEIIQDDMVSDPEAGLIVGSSGDGESLSSQKKKVSRSEFLKDLKFEKKYRQAALYVDDARNGRSIDHCIDIVAMRLYRFYHHAFVQAFFLMVVLLLLSLALFEKPTNIANLGGERVTSFLEICLVHILLFEVILKLRINGFNRFLRDHWTMLELIVSLFLLLDCTVTLIFAPHLRVFRLLRPFYLLQRTRLLRSSLKNIFRALPEIANVLVLITVAIFFFGVFAVNFFMPHITTDTNFDDLIPSFVHLLVLMTTANYPDVMMPEYRSSHWTIFFFFSYLCLTLYFLMNFVLAVIYNRYRQHLQEHVQKQFDRQRLGLCAAFQLLDDEMKGVVDYTAFKNLFAIMRPDYGEDILRVVFNALDSSGQGALSLNDFYGIWEVLGLTVRPYRRNRNLFEYFPWIYDSGPVRRFKRLVRSSLFDIYIDVLIVFNGVFIIWELKLRINEQTKSQQERAHDPDFMRKYYNLMDMFDFVSWMFTVVFSFEIASKIFALGIVKFFKNRWNCFDFFIVAASLIGKLFSFLPEQTTNRWANSIPVVGSVSFVISGSSLPFLLRLLRLLRVLSGLKRFKVIITTLFELLPAFVNFTFLEVAVFYCFAIVGMELFQFKPKEARDRREHAMINSAYDALGYYDNNFDNFQNSMVTLFELMVVNNWHVLMGGFVAATNDWAQIFFIAFYVSAVVIMLNLVVAFILEAFLMQWDKNKDKENTGGGRSHEMERRILFQQREQEYQSATRRLVVKRKNLKVEQVLHEMFTQELVEVDDDDIKTKANSVINLPEFRKRRALDRSAAGSAGPNSPPPHGDEENRSEDSEVWL